jgi:beta-aspartyl-peptidase (threonine type)
MRRFYQNRRRRGGRTGLRRFAWVLFLSAGLISLVGCRFQRHETRGSTTEREEAEDPSAAIREMLAASAASWNGGDLDGFMDDYWASDQLTFSGATGVTRGWQNVRDRYMETYWAPDADRDSLRFEDLEVRVLGGVHAMALGRYVLFRPQEGTEAVSSGFFTLVLRRTSAGWKIIHDHTSATPDEDRVAEDGG